MRIVCDGRMEDVREDHEGEGHRCVFRLSRPVGSLLTATDPAPDGDVCCCSVIRSSSSIASWIAFSSWLFSLRLLEIQIHVRLVYIVAF
jgi:hypothetical protein